MITCNSHNFSVSGCWDIIHHLHKHQISCLVLTITSSLHHPPTYFENEADVGEPLRVLQGRQPLGAGAGEADGLEALETLPHCVDVGDVQVGQTGVGIVTNVLCPLSLEERWGICSIV